MSNRAGKRRRLRLGEVEATSIFGPNMWIALSFLMYFVVPAFVSMFITRVILGYGDLTQLNWRREILSTLFVISAFVALTLATSHLIRRLHPPNNKARQFLPPNNAEIMIARVSFVTGLFCAYLLGQAFSGDMRSGLVATSYGQLIFAGSYGAIVGYFALALRAINRRNYIWLIIITIVFVSAFVVLGGRGRVIWPLLSVFATYQITRNGKVHVIKLALSAIILFFSASIIDPLLSLYYGYGKDALLRISSAGSLIENVFVLKRNFDGFHNFYLIFNIDPFPRSFSYLIDGPRTAFMMEFFPQVLARGVGFPATVPGTFWMVGGWVGLFIGAVAFGSLAGFLSSRFNRNRNQLSICFQIYLFTWIFNIGLSLFDNMPKIIVVIILMMPFFAARKLRF